MDFLSNCVVSIYGRKGVLVVSLLFSAISIQLQSLTDMILVSSSYFSAKFSHGWCSGMVLCSENESGIFNI